MKKKYRFMGVLLAGAMAVTAVPGIAEPFTVSASAASAKKLAAPKGVSSVMEGTTAKVTWKAVAGADAYRVFLYNSKSGKFEFYKNVSTPVCKIKDLSIGSTYKIKLAALVKSGSGLVEQTISDEITIDTKLPAPTGLSAEIYDTNAKVSWKAVEGAYAYRVFLYNAKTKRYELYKNVSTPVCKFKDLKPGNTYKIKIAALVKSGSKLAVQTPTKQQTLTTKLSAPANFKAAVTEKSIKLSWSAVKGAAAYRVYVYDTATKKYVEYKNMSGTTCTITDFKAGQTYKYKVAALVKSGKTYKAQLQSSVVSAVVPVTEVAPTEHVSGYNYGSTKYPFKHDIAYMKQLNSDFVGWLQIKDTPIDLPVVQASNNDYYLTHTFYGEYDTTKVGTTFADSHSPVTENFRPDNLVIYGHNIRTGVGLAKITNYYPARYGSLNFYLTHPTFTYESVYGGEKTYVVFAGMFVNTELKHGNVFNYYRFRNFKNEATFYQYFEQVFDRSVFYNPDLDIKYGDKFITLSTCFYPMGADVDTRFVVLARELRPGEKAISTKNAYTNKSPLYFDYYYRANGGSWAGRKWSESLIQGYSEWKKKNS